MWLFKAFGACFNAYKALFNFRTLSYVLQPQSLKVAQYRLLLLDKNSGIQTLHQVDKSSTSFEPPKK